MYTYLYIGIDMNVYPKVKQLLTANFAVQQKPNECVLLASNRFHCLEFHVLCMYSAELCYKALSCQRDRKINETL